MRKNMRRRVSTGQWRVCHPLVILLHASCVFFFSITHRLVVNIIGLWLSDSWCSCFVWLPSVEYPKALKYIVLCLRKCPWVPVSLSCSEALLPPRVVLQVGKVAHLVLCCGGWREIQPNKIRHSLGIFALDNSVNNKFRKIFFKCNFPFWTLGFESLIFFKVWRTSCVWNYLHFTKSWKQIKRVLYDLVKPKVNKVDNSVVCDCAFVILHTGHNAQHTHYMH